MPWLNHIGKIQSIVISGSVSSIGNFAFSSCSSVDSITIPESVTSIGDAAFYNCAKIKSISIPNSVNSIGAAAFHSCTGMTRISIPDKVTAISPSTFTGCSSLTQVDLSGELTLIKNSAFYKCTSLSSIVLPSSVTLIDGSAFLGCTSLKSVNIPTNVTSIGDNAFYECTSLKSVNIPTNVTSIGDNAFYECTSLKSIDIPSNVKSIGSGAFQSCTSLSNVKLAEGLVSIGSFAFSYCESLTNITIPGSVTSIGEYALSYCPNLDTVIYDGEDNPAKAENKHGGDNTYELVNLFTPFGPREVPVVPRIYVKSNYKSDYFGNISLKLSRVSPNFKTPPIPREGYKTPTKNSETYNIEISKEAPITPSVGVLKSGNQNGMDNKAIQKITFSGSSGSDEENTNKNEVKAVNSDSEDNKENKKANEGAASSDSDSEQKENEKPIDGSTLIDSNEDMSDEEVPDFGSSESENEDEQSNQFELNDHEFFNGKTFKIAQEVLDNKKQSDNERDKLEKTEVQKRDSSKPKDSSAANNSDNKDDNSKYRYTPEINKFLKQFKEDNTDWLSPSSNETHTKIASARETSEEEDAKNFPSTPNINRVLRNLEKDFPEELGDKDQQENKNPLADFENPNDEKKAVGWDEKRARDLLDKLIAKDLPSTPPLNPLDPKNPYGLDDQTKKDLEDFLDNLNPGYPKESSYEKIVFRMHGKNRTFSIKKDPDIEVIKKVIPYYSKVTFDVNAANPLKETIRCAKIGCGIPAMLESYVEKNKGKKTKEELSKNMRGMLLSFLSNVCQLVTEQKIQGKQLKDFPEHMRKDVKKIYEYVNKNSLLRKDSLKGHIEQTLNKLGIQ